MLAPRPTAPSPTSRFGPRGSRANVALARAVAKLNEFLDWLPVSVWWYRRALRRLEFTSVEVGIRGLGPGLDGTRVVFLSDLHAGSFVRPADLARLFEGVAALEPDVICLGGDLVNTRARDLQVYAALLDRLRPPLGIHAVPGNHEYFWTIGVRHWQEFLSEHGVEVLVNRGTRLERDGATLWLAGVDDLSEGEPDLQRALQGRGAGEPTVLLSHHPDVFPDAQQAGVDLQLSGHTHGGQVRLFGWMPLKQSKLGLHAGYVNSGRTQLYVGRGVGAVILPLRVGARPEVPVVTLRSRP